MVHYAQPYYAEHGSQLSQSGLASYASFENVHQRMLDFLLPLGIRYRLRPREASISNLIFISWSMWMTDCVTFLIEIANWILHHAPPWSEILLVP
jgi:hypothetical protein